MKESITKFDLEAAFKALDELETPAAKKGIKANKPALTEIFSRKSKFDALFEEYYDIGSTEELTDAKDTREAEIAKAKLARIEKIVDLDAESPDDLLTSYVGKYIIQCPQCMTLFYKNPEDVEESEDDAETVNVNEVCQHCGNESGYTLIGKVGAADDEQSEESPEEPASDEGELDLDLDDDEAGEDAGDEAAAGEESGDDTSDEEDFDLDAISFDDEEEEETKEEAFETKTDGNYLLEQLEEAADTPELDISEAEFEELLNSDEFKKPISDTVAQAMLDDVDESFIPDEALTEAINVNGEELKYAVIKPDGSFAGVPCTTEEEARELAAQEEGRIIVKLDEADIEALNEGGLGLLGKTLKKKAGQVVGKIKSKASDAIDKFADNTMTREEKAQWVLTHTLKPEVKEVEIDNEGKVIPNEEDQKYHTFVVIGYKGHYSSGRTISAAPSHKSKDLVIGMSEPQFREGYAEAEELAKGWSMEQKGGPACIFLAKDKKDSEATFLCQFFKGELVTNQDNLEALFNKAKQDLEGKAHITKGGGVSGNSDEPQTKETTASALKSGDKIVVGDEVREVVETGPSKFGGNKKAIKSKGADGDIETDNMDNDATVIILVEQLITEADNNISTIMENFEEINEAELEKLISKTLFEAYNNVLDFDLVDCSYLNEQLTVSGSVLFDSGKSRDVSYTFTEAFEKENFITFKGINEKLGADKSFTLTGKLNNKVFIAESFSKVNND